MKNIVRTLLIAVVYILLFISSNNYSLLYSTLRSDFPLFVKLQLFFSVIAGIGTSMSLLNLITLLVIAVLTGVNILLVTKRILLMKTYGPMHVVVGGSSLLGLASSGCASCGLPLLALFGFGSSVGFLPLKGYEFSLLTIGLLLFSLRFLIKQNTTCEI